MTRTERLFEITHLVATRYSASLPYIDLAGSATRAGKAYVFRASYSLASGCVYGVHMNRTGAEGGCRESPKTLRAQLESYLTQLANAPCFEVKS